MGMSCGALMAYGAAADPRVEYAEPNYYYRRADTMPDDEFFDQMWGLYNPSPSTPGADIGAVRAWDITTGSDELVAVVLDSGVDLSHPDLAPNAWVNPGDATGVPLPDIGKSVKATVELGVESGSKSAIAEVALVQAKLVDDPTSPYFPAVKRLMQIRDLVAAKDMNRGHIKNAIDEAMLADFREQINADNVGRLQVIWRWRAVNERSLIATRPPMPIGMPRT